MGWLTANRSEPQTAQQTTCCMVPQIAVLDGAADGSALGTPDGGIDSIDHSPPGDVAERQANGTLFGDTDGAADGAVDGAADVQRSVHSTALSTDKDHSSPEGVADGSADGSCSETQTSQQTARWMVSPMAQHSAHPTAASK